MDERITCCRHLDQLLALLRNRCPGPAYHGFVQAKRAKRKEVAAFSKAPEPAWKKIPSCIPSGYLGGQTLPFLRGRLSFSAPSFSVQPDGVCLLAGMAARQTDAPGRQDEETEQRYLSPKAPRRSQAYGTSKQSTTRPAGTTACLRSQPIPGKHRRQGPSCRCPAAGPSPPRSLGGRVTAGPVTALRSGRRHPPLRTRRAA